MRVACVQLQAYDLARAEEGLAHALAMTEQALAHRPDLIVLPECTYPAYFLAEYERTPLRPPEEVLSMFACLARRGHCYLAVGLVERSPEGPLFNGAILLSPAGEVAARAYKHFLWHFDRRWFAPGTHPALATTPWGKVGMFICADGRLPEIPRLLALGGARLQLDLTGWVSSGRAPERLTNPQAEYMLRVRALENRCYVAAANKVGMEAGRIVYCGHSQIISPDGQVLARAGSSCPEIIWADVALSAPVPPLWPDFDPLRDRHPAAYRLLTSPAVAPARAEPEAVRLAALQVSHPQLIPSFWEGLAHEDTTAAVTSLLPGRPGPGAEGGTRAAPPVRVQAWADERGPVARLEIAGQALLIDPSVPPEDRVHDTPAGRLGIMLNREALLPEVPRVLALQGAEWLAWPCSLPTDLVEAVARTRAAENRVFVVAANSPAAGGESLLADPDGRILAQAFPRTDQSVAAQAHLCLARDKTIVPGTDAFAGRQPHLYTALTA